MILLFFFFFFLSRVNLLLSKLREMVTNQSSKVSFKYSLYTSMVPEKYLAGAIKCDFALHMSSINNRSDTG